MTVILGIETSCDETAAAVVEDGRRVRANVIATQEELHAKYAGVVPEIASRAHVERIDGVVRTALEKADVAWQEIDAIAIADGPGLVGSLLIGMTAAKTLAWSLEIPLIAVDHIAAHATSAALACDEAPWPAVALVVSGGHTSLYHVADFDDIKLIGQTVDDAAGEAYDKVAAILELGFPGGPAVDQLARRGNPKAYRFPRTWINEDHANFSFSGLKTAVLYQVHGVGNKYGDLSRLSDDELADVAASFQAAIVETLATKTIRAARKLGVKNIVVGGGVAANSGLRQVLTRGCEEAALKLTLTPMEYCTDNAAMIAALGYHHFSAGEFAPADIEPRSGLVRPAKK
ncbi:MAG: tRNA (adenosine(37)-N6)-threonylcarbamoyltransferase complex transferase subunit TsaD [Phycisphaerae bacterium]